MDTESEQQHLPPEILYKYRDWTDEYSKRAIKDLEVFFPSPRRFNDPFDCAIPFDPFGSAEDVIRTIAAGVVDREMPRLHSILRRFETESRVDEFKKRFKDQESREDWRENTQKDMANRYGVLSLSEDPVSLLMWSYYADKHAGFCVGYDARVLFDEVREFHDACILLPVKYQQGYPDLALRSRDTRIDTFNAMLTTKAIGWEHEQEYRLILNGKNEVPILLPKSAIVEVIVGTRMCSTHVEEIESLLQGHGLLSTLRRAELAKDEYAITIEQFPSE